jgi:DNA-binding transcriptional ArsR family regulator
MSGRAASEAPGPDSPGPDEPVPEVVVMRALAHPARLGLLEHLAETGPATATECAEVVGQSPSAVSYHLRALARAGLVEAAPGRGDGRERLWRRTDDRYQIHLDGAPQDPEMREAQHEVIESLLARDEARTRAYLARFDGDPEEWQEAAHFMSSTLLMTAEELKALGTALEELVAPYRRGARTDPPPGARQVAAIIRTLPRG